MIGARDKLLEGALWLGVLVFGLLGSTRSGLYGPEGWQFTARDPKGLRIVVWNVGGSTGRGGHGLDDDNLEQVSDTLRMLDADLCLLLELGNDEQLRSLARPRSDVTIRAGSARLVAGIARRGTLEVMQGERDTARQLNLLYTPWIGSPVQVVALHADAWSAKERNRQIGRAANALDGAAEHARLLCGDLNLDVDPGGRGDLFSDDDHLDVETYNYVASRALDLGLRSGPTAEPDRRLDYAFLWPGPLRAVAAGPWYGRRQGDMDHHPLVVDLAWE